MSHDHSSKKGKDDSGHERMDHSNKEEMDHSGGGGHLDHHVLMELDFRRRFFVSLAITGPILIFSPTIQQWFYFTVNQFPGYDYVLFGLATVIAIYGGWPF